MCCHPDLFPRINSELEPWRFVLAIAGGGSQAIGEFLRRGGQSDVLLEAHSLQSRLSTSEYIGSPPDHYTSSETARSLAMISYMRAKKLSGNNGNQVFGIGSSATLVSRGERDGRQHKIYISLQTKTYTTTVEILLGQERSRVEEEQLASRLIGVAIQWGLHQFADMQTLLTEHDKISVVNSVADDNLIRVVNSYHLVKSVDFVPRFLLSSSCNPLHAGHMNMTNWVDNHKDDVVYIELCVKNADKPRLDYTEVDRRVNQVELLVRETRRVGIPYHPVILSNAGLYNEKALLYPGCTFLVGSDTIERVNDVRFADNSKEKLNEQFEFIKKQGCRFIVFPRANSVKLDPKKLNRKLRKLCRFVTEKDGYIPSSLSSTSLRSHA